MAAVVNPVEILATDESHLEQTATLLALGSQKFSVVHLIGDLGAGKTTWVRAYLRALGVTGRVKSPTFTLVESYDTSLGAAHHFDLYRLEDPEELEFLGIRDFVAEGGQLFFEWPERGGDILPSPDLTIEFRYENDGRSLRFFATSEEDRAALEKNLT